jgi:adenosylmethionine---8-amino-7-oxononanoate aminotransferase
MATAGELTDADHGPDWRGRELRRHGQPADTTSRDGAQPVTYIDGFSSTWCDARGRCHPTIDAAIHAQLQSVVLDAPAGLDQPARELAQRLIAIAPAGLDRVLYADRGQGAVTLAVELARDGCRRRPGGQRTQVIGADEDAVARLAADGPRIAAVVVEPLVRAATGMRVHPPGHLRRVRALCDYHGVLLICDETATAFGRTGTMFASEREGVVPDLLCVAGGLTGDVLPLAAVLTSGAVSGDRRELRLADPIACAAMVATLETLETEHTIARLGPKIELLAQLLGYRIEVLPGVAVVRQRGMLVGIELVIGAEDGQLVRRAVVAARRRGAVIGSWGDVIVLTPALGISEHDLRRLVAITASSIAEAYVGRPSAAAVTLRRA